MSWSWKKGAAVVAAAAALGLLAALSDPLVASPEATTTFRFQIEEAVAVFVRSCWEQTISLDITRLGQDRYLYFPCPIEVVMAAITDYELRLAASAAVERGLSRQEIAVEPLEVRLDRARMTGLGCLPSSARVSVNEQVVEFIPAVEFPDSLLLFRGCNNTANPTTSAPLEARVDLHRLSGELLAAGARVNFTLRFIIIEK
jgi:hypothetical protein